MEPVKCPHCSVEMEHGWSYVRAQSVAWYKTEQPPIADQLFPESFRPTWPTLIRKNPSLRCRACRIVVIEFPDGEWA